MNRISESVYAQYGEDRHKHEVEFVAKKSGNWIKGFLEEVKLKRGFDAYKRLRDDVAKIWRKL